MASYNELNALIDAYINRNGVQAITGQILNGVLKAMVEQLGRGYTIMGAATPATDPGTPDGPECWFASETGTYTDFDGLQVAPGELALLCYTPSDGWTKATIYEGFRQVGATIDGNVGTPSVGVSYANGVLSFDFRNMKGNPGQNGQNGQDGAAAGFGTIGADITGGVGTPGVTVESSGPATAKNLQFHFTNLKGETGVTSVVATVDNTTGNPACTVSLVGQQLTLAFSGLKGAQGNTGSSVDYPFTIVNNLTTDDATQALSAAQGVVLDGKVTQLEADVDSLEMDINGGSPVYSIERTFPAGQAIAVGTKIDFSLPKGKYNLVSSKSINHGILIYFWDADGNAVKPTDKTSQVYNSLSVPNYTTRNPFDFPADVVKISYYSASAPASDMDVSLVATSISVVAGLKDKVLDLEEEVNTLSGTMGAIEENVSDIEESVETLDVQINGGQNVIEFSKTFPSGTLISPGTKYDLVFPSGKYNLVTSKSSEAGLTMYFYDSDGNAIAPTDKNNQSYNGISLPNYTSLNPFNFPADVAKVAFYSAVVPEADVIATFEATAIASVIGLKSRVQDLETGMEDAEGDISVLDERVTALEGGGGHKVVSYTCTKLSQLTISDGYWWNGEHSSNDWSYFAVENLKEGDVLIVASHTAQAILMRFVDTYNGSTRVSDYADNSSYRRIVRVPLGVDKVYITIPRNAVSGQNFLMRGTFVDGSPASVNNNIWIKSADSLSENAELVLGDGGFQVRKNQVYDAKCRFSTFSSIMFGQGFGTNKEGRVEVDSTNVKVFIRGEASPIHNSVHGLSITSFLFVTILVKYSGRGSLVLVSDSGTYTVADFAWEASSGDIKFVPGMAVTDVSLSYASKNLLNDVWMFGDSYMSFANNREPYYLHEVYGAYDDVLSSGYSGAGSADCVSALMTYLQITRPKYIVWLAGMNDQDTNTEASRTWLDSVNFARDVCRFYGAKLILATIPNVPSILHTFKNAIVKTSPEQYIDLANAVGAEEAGSTWNPSAGLSEDNVHPSILGAQLLAAQIVLDFPQIFRTK